MKKQIIAAAVASAVAVPAVAQVTVYGRIDAGYNTGSVTTALGVKTKTSGPAFSRFTSSRLGFQGTEDLGGGLKASFVMEGEVRADTTTSVTANDSYGANGYGFGRAQNVSLSGGFGTILLGKTDSMYKSVFDAYDAGYSNNLVGAMDSMTNAATGGNHVARRDVTARYTLPSISGIALSVGVTKASSDIDSLAGKIENNTGTEVGVRYATGPLSLALAYRSVKVDAEETAAGNADNTRTDAKSTAAGVSYNLGPAMVFLQHFNHVVEAAANNSETGMAVGIRVPFGASTFFASYTDGDRSLARVNTDLTGYQVGIKHDLSKRTYLYGAFGDTEQIARAARTKAVSNDFAIGVAHHF